MDGTCVGEASPWACRLATDGTDAERAWARLASGQALPPPPEPEPQAEPAANPRRALLKLARACEHAGPWIGDCACTRRCAIYTRDVAISDCLRCVRDGGLEG